MGRGWPAAAPAGAAGEAREQVRGVCLQTDREMGWVRMAHPLPAFSVVWTQKRRQRSGRDTGRTEAGSHSTHTGVHTHRRTHACMHTHVHAHTHAHTGQTLLTPPTATRVSASITPAWDLRRPSTHTHAHAHTHTHTEYKLNRKNHAVIFKRTCPVEQRIGFWSSSANKALTLDKWLSFHWPWYLHP